MKKIAILSILASTVIMSCKKQSVTCFGASKTTVEAGESISFENCSVDNTKNLWMFGDGTTSTEATPSHAYTKAGTYTVTLTTYGKKSNNAYTQSLVVYVSNVNEKFSLNSSQLAEIKEVSVPRSGAASTSQYTSSIPNLLSQNGTNVFFSSLPGVNSTIKATVSGNSISAQPMDSLQSSTWLNPYVKLRSLNGTYDDASKKITLTWVLSNTEYTTSSSASVDTYTAVIYK